MSCYSYVDQYANENEDEKKEIIVNEAIECLRQEEERRTQEIHEFIDDFITSHEYQAYVKAKSKIMKRPVGTQCDENDIIVEVQYKDFIDKYPLTEERKKMYAFKEQFEKYSERQKNLDLRKKQEKGIKAIREIIEAGKLYFYCTKESAQRKREKRDERLLQHYSSRLGTNLSQFTLKTRAKILDRVKTHHRVISTRREKRRQSIFNIIEKLLFDYGVKKEVKKYLNKTYDYKVKSNEKIIEDMEVVGTKIELIDREKIVEVNEKPKVDDKPESELEEKGENKKSDGKEKDKKEKKDKKETQETKPKDKKPAKEKMDKKIEKVDAKLGLPFVPVVNPRDKIVTENIDQMLNLVDEFRNFDSELENKDMMEEKDINYILGDTGMESRPKSILFQNYDEGKIYYKTILITNVSHVLRKLRFLKFSFQDQYDEVVFDVENFGIRKLYIGCHVKFWINFQPYDVHKSYEGKIIFLSYDIRKCQYYQFGINVKCIPKYSNLQIYPKTVDFGRMPIWKATKVQNSKSVKFINKGAKSCRIYIHKIADPLNIEAIFDDNENKENVAPDPENSSTSSVDGELLSFIEDMICSCIDNVDNNFCFEETFFTLEKFEEIKMTVIFKNMDYVGNYFEKFTVDVYEKLQDEELDIAGCQEITLLAETTGHFLSVNPEVLDFGICHIKTCYTISFEIFNSSKYTQAVSVRLPSNIVDMVQADISTVYLPPQGKRVMWLKLVPREYIFRDSCIYFDKNTAILEFPIQIYMVSKNYRDFPPIKLPVYTILSNIQDMSILITHRYNISNFLDTILVDMKTCSIYETIWAEIFVLNNTLLTQFCGFLDLPQCVTLEPNQGFMKLYPNQRKKFKLYFSPEIRDYPSFPVGSLRNNKYFFKLRIDTISNIGQIKNTISAKKLRSTLETMLKELEKTKLSAELSMYDYVAELKKDLNTEISHSMVNKGIASAIRTDSIDAIKGTECCSTAPPGDRNGEEKFGSFDDTMLNYQNFVILETNSRKVIWCKVTLRRPLLEFSHQMIEFPDTPCGSYSIMEIRLRAVEKAMEAKCEVTHKKKCNKLEYSANFTIMGDSEEISVQPKCGTLKAGQSVKITLVAKPNVPKEIVEQTAKSIKYSQIYELKLQEYFASRIKKIVKKENEVKGNKEKGKKNEKSKREVEKKDGKAKKTDTTNKQDGKRISQKEDDKESVREEIPTFVITDKEMEYDYSDLYPAEMVHWRNMEPYYIKAKFTCCVDYHHGIKTYRKPDWLYLNATCKVTRPDFISGLKLQRLDFGKCAIGMSTRKEIMLQNITYDDIEIKTTLLNPVCCFSIPFIRDVVVPPEHSLKLSIDFSPVSTDKVTEYVEVRSNVTILPLILCGEGIIPNINITPNFTVFRMETKQNHFAELHLKIENASEAPVSICLEKIFEIEGRMSDYGKHKEEVQEDPKDLKNKKDKKEKEKKMSGKEKVQKFSDSLTDQELQAIDVCFKNVKDNSHFDLSTTEKCTHIQPNSHHTVTIYFGDPEQLRKRKIDKDKKGKKEKEDKHEKSDEAGSKKSGDKKGGDGEKQYITQYNVFVGKAYIKSIIVLSTII